MATNCRPRCGRGVLQARRPRALAGFQASQGSIRPARIFHWPLVAWAWWPAFGIQRTSQHRGCTQPREEQAACLAS
eukprot:4443540-Alexandrium_andersonii.AAC.1